MTNKKFIKPEDAERGFYKEYFTLADVLSHLEKEENGFNFLETVQKEYGAKNFSGPQMINAFKIYKQEVKAGPFHKFLTWYLVTDQLTEYSRWLEVETVSDIRKAKNEAENANIYVTSQKGSYRKEAKGQNDHRNAVKKDLRNEAKRDLNDNGNW